MSNPFAPPNTSSVPTGAHVPPSAQGPVPPPAQAPVPPPPGAGLSRTAVGLITGAVCLVVGGGLGFVGGVASDAGERVADWYAAPAPSDAGDDEHGDEPSDDEWYGGWEGSGTPEDPWFFDGLSIGNEEWDVWLDLPYEATADLLAHSDVNVAPPAGTEYWIVPVTATYHGPSSQVTAWGAFHVGFVGADGTEATGQCGAVPDALVGAGLMGTEDTVTGNVCLAVPAGAQGLWTLSVDGNERSYIAADPGLAG